ncbi:hypothetical protein C8J57DRAFT_82539 [Mycena rebaudengoi]|nr:hypothetical protein C8J57DRAFT_82539 [Mycena rebaudengoi]
MLTTTSRGMSAKYRKSKVTLIRRKKSQTSPSHNWVDDTDEPWAVDQQPAAKWATSADDVPVKTGKRNRNKNAGSSVCWTRNINDTEWALEPDADGANPSPHVVEDNGSDLLEPTDEYPVDQQDAQKWITTEIDVAEDTRSAEQTWDAPWPEADPAIKPTRSRAKCKYFGQGDCHWGDACNFRHVIDQPSHHWDYADQNVGGDHGVEGVEEPEPPQELPTIDPPPVIEPDNPRSMYHCTVHFGAGAVPERVVTAFESHRLILSNLPAGFAHADLLELAGQYGTVNNTMFHLTSAGMQAHVEFEEKSQAADAALRLNGFAIDELVLNARIDSASYVSSRIYDDGSRQIKLVWAAPSVSGWAFYPTITLAKAESSRLNGSVLGARKITATYQSPKRNQTHSFAVHFAGLPLHVDRARLQTFCPGADSVALNAPNYHAAQNGSIRACLAAFGPVVSFVALPTDSADLEIVAFAEFGTARAAADARSRLDGVPHEFLGNGSISVKAVFHSKYTCPARRFALIRDELKRLRAPCADGCTVQYYEQQDEPCTVHVYGRRLKVVAQVRNAVQRLLFGCEVGCWDSFFDTASSDEALRNLNTADAPFFIHNDRRARVLRLWGDREQGEKRLSRLNKYIQAKRHRLALDDGALAAVLRGGLQALHDEFGESKVVLDVRGRELTVLGDVQRLRLVEERVRALAPPSPESCAEAGGVCALCAAAAAAEHVTLACTHVYCAGCLTHLLRPVPGVEFTPPTCVAQVDGASLPCLAPIPLAVVGAQLSASEQALLFDAALLSYVRANAELRFCVSGCGTLYRGGGVPGTVITCPECLMRLCPCCDVPFHEGLTCVQYQTLDEEDPV